MLPIFTNIPLTLLPAKIYHCHIRGRYLITFIPNNQFLSIRYELIIWKLESIGRGIHLNRVQISAIVIHFNYTDKSLVT